MIDFTNSIKKNKAYAGANGSKIAVVYNGEQYMLKFPPFPTINKGISYTNSCISEYIGCKIFESVGIPVQETILGTYTSNGKTKIVVACKDFTKPGITMQDFASLKNSIRLVRRAASTPRPTVRAARSRRLPRRRVMRRSSCPTTLADAIPC